MRITLFRKILGHLNHLLRIVPEVFETFKPCFASEKLRRLCSLKPILLQQDEEKEEGKEESKAEAKTPPKPEPNRTNEFTPIESDDGLLDNYIPLLEPFES